jgi:hypothetical protein
MRFKFDVFDGYKVLLKVKHESIIMWWMTNLNTGMEHLAFDVNQQHIWAIHLNLQTRCQKGGLCYNHHTIGGKMQR